MFCRNILLSEYQMTCLPTRSRVFYAPFERKELKYCICGIVRQVYLLNFCLSKTKQNIMKSIVSKLTLLMISIVLVQSSQAKIWRLNNNGNNPVPAITADYTGTLQSVHDNVLVLSGDTIHVEQSPTTYGACIFTKRLIIIGPGYFLNLNPQTQVNTNYGATVGNLTFYNAASAASHVYGLTTGTVYMGVNNLLISRCNITGLLIIGNTNASNISGMAVRQCYHSGAGNYVASVQNNTGAGLITNMEFTNNIFAYPTNLFQTPITLDNRVSGLFKNNVVYGYYAMAMQGFYLLNNMQYSATGSGNTFANSIFENNLGSVAGHFVSPAGTGNTAGPANQTATLAQQAYVGGPSTDGAWKLGVSSVGVGAGKDGVDAGAYAGDYPYKLSGIAPVPNIYALTIAPISAGATTISVTISAKGNN